MMRASKTLHLTLLTRRIIATERVITELIILFHFPVTNQFLCLVIRSVEPVIRGFHFLK